MKKNFKIILLISAFFIPVYFVFYQPMSVNPTEKFNRLLWKTVFAGFAFYALLAFMFL